MPEWALVLWSAVDSHIEDVAHTGSRMDKRSDVLQKLVNEADIHTWDCCESCVIREALMETPLCVWDEWEWN